MTASERPQQIVPPPGVLTGPLFEFMNIEMKFIFCALVMQAAQNNGVVKLWQKDWQRWRLPWETIQDTIAAMETHELITTVEKTNLIIISFLNWQDYRLK